jgi:2-polyprenyl-3-methyl-5-hydroxy-6-metoxy-1,4-benzoquinol methylase
MPKRNTAQFFDSYAEDFNAIYGRRETLVNRIVSRLFRRSMRLRFEKTIEGCRPVEGKSALDIGCGPGHYAVTLARRGMPTVMGIDFAPTMIELAEKKAAEAGVDDICHFFTGDFLTYNFDRTFDFTILMGFMDYMSDPGEVISRALSLTTGKAFFSFPAAEGFLAWQRRRRYRTRCDLYMYRREEIRPLFEGFSFKNLELIKLGRDYFATVEMCGE